MLAIALANNLARAVLNKGRTFDCVNTEKLPPPTCLILASCPRAVKAQIGSVRARRQDSTVAGLDSSCARPVCSRRPGRRNDLQARTNEQRDVRSYR